jgi:uncharacterized membrane protein YbhN (UPF0104 family)
MLKTPNKKHLFLLLKIFLAFSLLYILYRNDKINLSIFKTTEGIESLLAIILSLITIITVITAYRWNLCLRKLSTSKVSFLNLIKIHWAGMFAGSLIGGIVVADSTRLVLVKKNLQDLSLINITNSLIIDRITSLTGLFIIGLVSATGYIQNNILLFLAGIIFALLLLYLIYRRFSSSSFFEKYLGILKLVFEQKSIMLQMVGISVIGHSLKILCFLAILYHFGFQNIINLEILASIATGVFIETIPITPSGLGTGHYAFQKLLEPYGVDFGADIYSIYFAGKYTFKILGVFCFISIGKLNTNNEK